MPVVTATPTGPFCGDGNKDAGEDCDDGNTLDCDACPSDCKNAPADCTPIGTPPNTTRAPQKVTLHLTNGEPLTSALFCLRYPAGTVGLPGTGAVPQRISGFQGQTSLNDFNNSAQDRAPRSQRGHRAQSDRQLRSLQRRHGSSTERLQLCRRERLERGQQHPAGDRPVHCRCTLEGRGR